MSEDEERERRIRENEEKEGRAAVERIKAAQRELNDALQDAALAGLDVFIETTKGIAVNGKVRKSVVVSASKTVSLL